MALEKIHLRKLLKLLFLDEKQRRSALRSDIREDLRREEGPDGGGGDFYAPFWADAKAHVFGRGDLTSATNARIAANSRRANLYPQLRDGFLLWWNERRRWTNEPFGLGPSLKSQFPFPGLDAIVKVDSVLSVTDGGGEEFVVYSYFAPEPILSPEAARLGLWLLTQAFPTIPAEEFRILDVIRGTTFSLDRTPLTGDEEVEFRSRYARLIQERDKLRKEYD
ncbi:hypothetical protein [Alteraurantiacibacter aquimixticola]|uniref:Uncharacterized protein n=1 Tax=Alteraurantiacibacter aquimixticola TaxID=2489173 RepID=A0A4T3F5Y2_9SPHN|nr:hypothetical protein [Alteraurantiacibacter aquimixticola]TIX50266.1 hypothetical protein E5222_08245 [Alteraurantiacibacter aquimixticola]